MPIFEYLPGSASWKMPTRPANTKWTHIKDRFSKNLVGQWLTMKFRNWIYQPFMLSFAPGIKTYKVHEEAAAATLGKYLRVPWRGQSFEKEFVPVNFAFGGKYEKRVVGDMGKRSHLLAELIRRRGGTGGPGAQAGGGQSAANGVKTTWGDKLKSLARLVTEKEELDAFLKTYKTHGRAVAKIRRYEKLAEEAGKEKGEVNFAGLGVDAPKIPITPSPSVKGEKTSDKLAKLLVKEWKGGELSEKEKSVLKKYRSTRNTVLFNGRHYALAMGEGTTTQLFQEVISERSVRKTLADIYNWRAYKDTGGRAMPPKELWKFHFNLGNNKFVRGESAEQWYERTYANTAKMLGDPVGRTMMHKFYDEGVMKRLNLLGINGVTGECLAKAMVEFSGGITQLDRIPGYESKKRYALDELNTRQITALHGYVIGQGFIGGKFKTPPPLSPARMNELIKQREELEGKGDKNDEWKVKLINNSIKDQEDYLEYANLASIEATDKLNRVKPWTSMVIYEDGSVGTTKKEITRDGEVVAHLPFASKPFYTIPHWDWPTILPEGLATMEHLRAYRPFVEKVVSLGKTLDVSAGELFYQHRQLLKRMIQQYTHDGSIDDGSDIAFKLAVILDLRPQEANAMHLVIHEHQERWDGAKFDHLRSQVRDLQYTLDQTLRTFYFGSGVETENYPENRPKAIKDRARFIRKTIMNQRFANIINDYNQTLQASHEETRRAQVENDPDKAAKHRVNAVALREDAEKVRQNFMVYVQTTLKDDVAIAVEKAENVNKRIEKVVEWLLGHGELMTTYFMKHSMAHATGPAGQVSYNKFAAQMNQASKAA